jgi:amino acid permease
MSGKIQKLSRWGTFIALIKGYSALASLLMPYSFLTGGWAISATMLCCSSVITTICACMLVDAGLKLKIYNYPMVVEKTLGHGGKVALDFFLALTQWSFVVSHVTYIYTTYKETLDQVFSIDSKPVYYILFLLLIYTPLSWVRNIARFSFTFLIGNLLVLAALTVVSVYAVGLMVS